MLCAGEQLAASDSYPEPLPVGARGHSRQDVEHFAKVALVAKAHELADVGDGGIILRKHELSPGDSEAAQISTKRLANRLLKESHKM